LAEVVGVQMSRSGKTCAASLGSGAAKNKIRTVVTKVKEERDIAGTNFNAARVAIAIRGDFFLL
jgi:hypothetical protein